MDWFRRMMPGRRGLDGLGWALLAGAAVSMALRRATGYRLFWTLAFVLLAVFFLRFFSRDAGRRYEENRRFMALWRPLARRFSSWADALRDALSVAEHANQAKSEFLSGQKVRVPRGKGRICITCPRCRAEFVRRT